MSARMIKFICGLIKFGIILGIVALAFYLTWCIVEASSGSLSREYEYQTSSGETGRAYGCHSFAGGMKCYKDGEVLLVEKYKIIKENT